MPDEKILPLIRNVLPTDGELKRVASKDNLRRVQVIQARADRATEHTVIAPIRITSREMPGSVFTILQVIIIMNYALPQLVLTMAGQNTRVRSLAIAGTTFTPHLDLKCSRQ